MAHKKAGGSSRNGRDSNPQYRGVKSYGGEHIHSGTIIIRQVGSGFHAGKNVGTGSDYTLYARCDGVVRFAVGKNKRRFVSIEPLALNA